MLTVPNLPKLNSINFGSISRYTQQNQLENSTFPLLKKYLKIIDSISYQDMFITLNGVWMFL